MAKTTNRKYLILLLILVICVLASIFVKKSESFMDIQSMIDPTLPYDETQITTLLPLLNSLNEYVIKYPKIPIGGRLPSLIGPNNPKYMISQLQKALTNKGWTSEDKGMALAISNPAVLGALNEQLTKYQVYDSNPLSPPPSVFEPVKLMPTAMPAVIRTEMPTPMPTAMPQMVTAMPQMVTAMPQMATAMPQMATAMPQMATAMPQMATAMPQMATAIPQMVTAMPAEILTAMPQQMIDPTIPYDESRTLEVQQLLNSIYPYILKYPGVPIAGKPSQPSIFKMSLTKVNRALANKGWAPEDKGFVQELLQPYALPLLNEILTKYQTYDSNPSSPPSSVFEAPLNDPRNKPMPAPIPAVLPTQMITSVPTPMPTSVPAPISQPMDKNSPIARDLRNKIANIDKIISSNEGKTMPKSRFDGFIRQRIQLEQTLIKYGLPAPKLPGGHVTNRVMKNI
jgi:hypothetical protein